MKELEAEIGDLLRLSGLTLGTVESATGGLIACRITSVPGSSDYYLGSVVSYTNRIKSSLVGVKSETLSKYGAVSAQVAQEMALGGLQLLGADICISDTGIAGPGGATPEKQVGLFYLGLAHHSEASSRKHIFNGGREENRNEAAASALCWLHEYLLKLSSSEGAGQD